MTISTQSRPVHETTASIFLTYMTELDLRGRELISSSSLRRDAEDYALNFISGEDPVDRERLHFAAKHLVDVVATHDAQFDSCSDESWIVLREKVRAALVAEKAPGYCE